MKRKITTKYSNDHLLKAIQAVKNGSSQFAAAKQYGVPRSTLNNKISGKSIVGKKSGPGTVLSLKEENCIEKWVICSAERGFPVIKRQFLRSIQLYLNANKRVTPFANNYPGRKFYKNFLERHPIIAKRIAQNLIKSRAVVTETQLQAWHAEVQKYCEEHGLLEALNDPMRVFNMDEKGFIITPKNEVVLAKRGQKAVYNRSQNDEKECVTALLGGNAAGIQTPPMLVYAYKRMPHNILLNLPANWSVGISDNGWQTQNTFYDYISNVFYKWLSETNITLPVILFIDGHKSHISLTLSEFCSAHQIELVALYPNATHVIQPMDVVVFKPLGAAWDVKVKDWKIAHEFAKIDKKDIAPILNESIAAVDYGELLRVGFKRCGLFPFDVTNINLSRLVPPSTSDISENQLYSDGESPKPAESKQEIEDKLKNFEDLIEPYILTLFRSSQGSWTGPVEYTALFNLWLRLYTDASAFVATENQDDIIMIDVKTTKSDLAAEHSPDHNNPELLIVGENGQLLNFDGTQFIVMGDNEIVVENLVADTSVPHVEECTPGIENSHIICSQSSVSNTNVEQLPVQSDIDGHLRFSCDQPENVTMNSAKQQHSQAQFKTISIKTKMLTSPESFNPDSFKKTFPIPTMKLTKKKNTPKEKLSTVITSEEWKENEQKKMREKERQEAEKEARKVEREKKKMLAEQLKAEKEIAKEKKRIEKAEKDAEKKKVIEKAEKDAEKKKVIEKAEKDAEKKKVIEKAEKDAEKKNRKGKKKRM